MTLFSIKKLTLNDKKKFLDFIKNQQIDDLSLFTRWRDSTQSSQKLYNFILKECNFNKNEGIRIIAKTKQNEIIGYGLVDFFEIPEKKHVAVVGTIVDKNHRSAGIGTELLKHEIKLAKKSKKFKIRATVHEHNKSSLKLHKSAGFKIEGKFVAEEFDGVYRNVLSLALFLRTKF